MTKEASLAEVGVAKDIMWDKHHGFGPESFTKDRPFLLVAIGNDSDQVVDLVRELHSLKLGDNVKVVSFVAPSPKEKMKEKNIAA